MKVHADCRHFDGFRPCRFRRPCDGCPEFDRPAHRVLLVNLDAMGDVVRTTALLAPLHRELPGAHVTWITLPRAVPLLDGVDGLDRVLPLAPWTGPLLRKLSFDLVIGVDKSLQGGALTMAARAAERRGFGLDEHGAIVPLDHNASYLYRLGQDDCEKFVVNRKPETQLLCEAVGWRWERDPYRIALSSAESRAAREWRLDHGVADGQVLVGFNTGSSDQFPYKRLTDHDSAQLVRLLQERCEGAPIALLGGPEDGRRNREIVRLCGERPPLSTPTGEGLRRGLTMVGACDVVVTGDSLGLHMAIGLGKPVVAWFGPSCHQEIDLYGRGAWVLSDVDCRPCMRPTCECSPECFRRVPLEAMAAETARMIAGLRRGEAWRGETRVGRWPTARRIE